MPGLTTGGDRTDPLVASETQCGMRMRWRSRSRLARPYMVRLSALMRLTWPSTAPEL